MLSETGQAPKDKCHVISSGETQSSQKWGRRGEEEEKLTNGSKVTYRSSKFLVLLRSRVTTVNILSE
jgi:hypothetical protein